MNITVENRKWLDDFNLSHPLVIAGPCSAETEDQVLKIARELQHSDVSIFRAGIWKPRTRPGGFEGVGAIGLKWLQKAKAEDKPILVSIGYSTCHWCHVMERESFENQSVADYRYRWCSAGRSSRLTQNCGEIPSTPHPEQSYTP